MIKSLSLTNFQSHKASWIEFHPHLNIIVGATNSGKTAILRALKKVIRDLPAGNAYITTGQDTCTITSVINDHVVTRKISRDSKGNTKDNIYILDDDQFTSFGKEIPQEIVKIINMPFLTIGDSLLDVHFSNQHDSPFLLSETASIKSKVMGTISGIHLIDNGVQRSKLEMRRNSNSQKTIEEEVSRLSKELESLGDVNELVKVSANCEKLLSRIGSAQKYLIDITKISEELHKVTYMGSRLKEELNEFIDLTTLNNYIHNIHQNISNLTEYTSLYDLYNDINLKVNSLESDRVFYTPINNDLINKTREKANNLSEIQENIFNLDRLDSSILEDTKNLENLNKDIDDSTIKWTKLLKKMKICPTCKQPTSDVEWK